MITCNLMGGLGNQIFQIFATISYAFKVKEQFRFLNVQTLGDGYTTLRYTFWDSFFKNFKPLLLNHDQFPNNMNIIKERSFKYNELPVNNTNINNTNVNNTNINNTNINIILSGYFQSYKYFKPYYKTICNLIGLEKMKDELLFKCGLKPETFKNLISLHFRIGDYVKASHCHPILTSNYYKNCLNYYKSLYPENNYIILYFCEDDDIETVTNSINELKVLFPEYVFLRGDNTLVDWEQMLLMSLCRHNIIANSTFSWWGAYFNSNEDKIVCYPSVWFGKIVNNDTSDLCPDSWIKISV